MAARPWFLGFVAAFAIACGSNNGSGGDGDGGTGTEDAFGTGVDAFEAVIDAPPFGGTCTPVAGAPQCSDCMDNDGDGKTDGFDPECSGPNDQLENSFSTGIPGDNIDDTYQDCFFDGDSGAGNDGCNQHVCCILQADTKAECAMLAPESNSNQYDKTSCYMPFGPVAVPQKCLDSCGKLTSPGCDCFGCCTICDANGCRDVIVNPAVSPACNDMNISDPGPDGQDPDIDGDGRGDGTGDEPCKRCEKTTCGTTECGGQTCILCPGQDPSELPAECNGNTACPMGYVECDAANNNACPAETYCQSGCCTGAIIL